VTRLAQRVAESRGFLYFGSFLFVGVFVVVNLFIAVVLNNLKSVKLEQAAETERRQPQHAVIATLEIRQRLDEVERHLRKEVQS